MISTMKTITRLTLACLTILTVSCASVDWSNPESIRPLATVATAAYVTQGDYLERSSREVYMRLAAAEIRKMADSDNPSAEAVRVALERVSMDPAYRAAVASLVRLYLPKVQDGASLDQARIVLRAMADGIEDAVPYVPTTSTK